MRKLTKLTLGTLAAHATATVLATPALADDGQVGALARPQTPPVAEVIHTTGVVLAMLAGVVLLSKAVARYRHSRWRREWILRHSSESALEPSVDWPAGGISGRTVVRPAAGIVGGTVARSATGL